MSGFRLTFQHAAIASAILAAGMIVLGLSLHPKPTPDHWILSAFLVCCGGFVLFMTLDALKSNQVMGDFWTASRQSGYFSYWFTIVMGFGIALALFIGAALW
jgi:uncharacterized membrane protein YjjB (DUF3815 family)